jgi:hypothetical protein
MGALAVTLSRGAWRQMALALAIGLAAAISLLPYWTPLLSVHQWDELVRIPLTASDLGLKLYAALSASGWSNGCVWAVLFASILWVSFRSQLPRRKTASAARDQELLLFCGASLAVGAAGYLLFLKQVSYTTPAWYFLALMAMSAILLDFSVDVFAGQYLLRAARLALALGVAITSLPLAWSQVKVRQSNVDLVAASLEQAAAPQDLIVVVPWYYGISFDRYYKGPTPWMTVPPLAAHDVHRYDLIKSQMMLPDQDEPVRPLLDRISQTLAAGRRVWLAGALPLASVSGTGPNPGPAPDAACGWSSAAYSKMWSAKVGALLRLSAKRSQAVQVGQNQTVSPMEQFGLMVFDGWSQP